MSWFLQNRNLKLLEPYDWKLSRTVLRGEGGSNASDLPGDGETGSVEMHNEVGIKDGCFGYIGENTGELLPFCYNKVTEEIAGNIFDNPELLKGGNE